MASSFKVGDKVDVYDDWRKKWYTGTITYIDATKLNLDTGNGGSLEMENSGGFDNIIRPAGEGQGEPVDPAFVPAKPPAARPGHVDPPTPQIRAAQQKSTADEPQLRAEEILWLINEYRASNNLKPLKMDPNLQLAAQNYANTLMELGGEGHEVGGTTFDQRILAACNEQSDFYWYAYTGENCAHGYGTEPAALQGWKTSPPHNRNMLRNTFDLIGVGVARRKDSEGGGFQWVTVFGQAVPKKDEARKVRESGAPTFKKGDRVYARVKNNPSQIKPGVISALLSPSPMDPEGWGDMGDNKYNQPVMYYGVDFDDGNRLSQPPRSLVSKADYEKGIQPPMPD